LNKNLRRFIGILSNVQSQPASGLDYTASAAGDGNPSSR
jgi:hypothetical protein